MSASREKQNRREKASSGIVSAKTAREARQMEEDRRSALLYGTIGVIFCVIVVVSAVWNSNILSRVASAVTVDGVKYTAAQMDFYYHSAYMNFVNYYNQYGYLSYMGLNTKTSLDSQTIDDTAAMLLGIEAGGSWKDYFLEQGIQQMTAVQNALKQAAEENFTFPESVEEQVAENMAAIAANAGSNAVSERRYLQGMYGSAITKGVYEKELRRLLQYQAYISDYQDNLSYTTEELDAYYAEHANDYDQVAYDLTTFRGTASSTTDEEGNTVEPTEQEQAEAAEAAKTNAAALFAALTGQTVETVETAVEAEAETRSTEEAASGTEETAEDADAASTDAGETTEAAEAADAGETTEAAEAADAGETTEAAEAADAGETTEETKSAEAGETAEEVETSEEEATAEEEAETPKAVEVLSASGVDSANMGTLSETYSNAYYETETDSTYDTIFDYTSDVLADWLYDSARKDGDAVLLDNQGDYLLAVYHSRSRDESKTVDVRHILIQPEEGTLTSEDEGYDAEQETLKAAAKTTAEELYAQWQEGDATEDTFAALAEEESSDPGSNTDGGLYTGVYQGQMVQPFNDWCFDAARKSGDTGIVETSYGYHIMYYVGEGLLKWQADVTDDMKSSDYEAFLEAFTKDAVTEQSGFGMSFVD